MTTSTDSDSGSSAKPLVDTPVEAFAEWDSPFRHSFVVGSWWAPWLTAARFPPDPDTPAQSRLPPLKVKAPEPPPPAAGDDDYARYRRDYEKRLDDAYAEWKRSIFVALFEPWIIDRRAAEAAKKLGRGVSTGS